MMIRRWGALALAALAMSACDGCGKMYYAPFREVPFCANDKVGTGPQLAKDYVLVTKHGDGFSVGGLRRRSRSDVVAHDDTILFAIIECGGPTAPAHTLEKKLEKMTDSHMPSICPGMSVVHQSELKASEDARSKGLGHAGYFVFPKVALACTDGTLVRREPFTLSEHLATFRESVEGYRRTHEERFPPDMTALVAETQAPSLPKDPWGSDLVVTFSATEIVVSSAGPDKKPGTADDEEAMNIKPSQTRSITVFGGTDYAMHGDYDAFLKAPKFTTVNKPAPAEEKKGAGGSAPQGEGGAVGKAPE